MGVWSTKYIASGTQLTSSSGQIVPPGARTPHVWEVSLTKNKVGENVPIRKKGEFDFDHHFAFSTVFLNLKRYNFPR